LILDSSAVVSMIAEEPGHRQLLAAVADAAEVAIGAPTRLESEMVMIGRAGAAGQDLVAQFLFRNNVVVIVFGDAHRRAAAEAFMRYGKGRHSAALNYGDCMTYATAMVAEHPLLFTGNDFAQTDIPVALPR
jgi:ribonuclease VapC